MNFLEIYFKRVYKSELSLCLECLYKNVRRLWVYMYNSWSITTFDQYIFKRLISNLLLQFFDPYHSGLVLYFCLRYTDEIIELLVS